MRRELAEAMAALDHLRAAVVEQEQRVADLQQTLAGIDKLCEKEQLILVGAKTRWRWTAEQRERLAASQKLRWAKRKKAVSTLPISEIEVK